MEKRSIVEIDKKYGILIGINGYDDDIIRGLKYSVADVKAFYEILIDSNRGGYNPENIRFFSDESSDPALKPTRSNIMSQLSSLAAMATTKDNILLYFSGHGIEENGQSFLLPQDARYNILDESAISIGWMKKVLISSDARVKIVILDACHSGAIKGKATSGYMTKGFQKSIFPPPEGFAVLSSCKMNEVSWEDDEMNHGVFSYFLTEGLQGAADYDQDSAISIMEASKYSFEKVTSWALANSRTQSPTLECSIYGDVILCQVPSDFVRPISTEITVETIRLTTTTIGRAEKTEYSKTLAETCGVLINFIEPDAISVKSEGKVVVFPLGEIEKKSYPDGSWYLDLNFNYDVKNRKIIDKIISRLDNSETVEFDIIEFFLSRGMDFNHAVKSFRKRGFNILSYDPSEKRIAVQMPSELGEKGCTMEIREKEKGVSIQFWHRKRFNPDFYDKINPKSVMEFSTLVQE